MPSMRTIAVMMLTVTLLFGLVPARRVLPVQVTGQATCDATLVTLLLVGIRDYGYQAPIRLDYYNFAQYRFLVEAATGTDLPPFLPEDDTATGDQVASLIEQVATQLDLSALPDPETALTPRLDDTAGIVDNSDETNAGTDAIQDAIQVEVDAVQNPGDADSLNTGLLPGEPEICSLLRADLVNFLYDHLHTDLNRP